MSKTENPLLGVVKEPNQLSEIPLSVLLRRAGDELLPEFANNGPSERFQTLSEQWAGQLTDYWKGKLSFFEQAKKEGKTQQTTRDQREHRLTIADQQYTVFQQLNEEYDLGLSRNRHGFIATIDIKWISPNERGKFGAAATIIGGKFSIYDMTIDTKTRRDSTSDVMDESWDVKIDKGKIVEFVHSEVKIDAGGKRWTSRRAIERTNLFVSWREWDDNIEGRDTKSKRSS